MSDKELEGQAPEATEASNKGVVPAGYAAKMKARDKTWLDEFIGNLVMETTGEATERQIAQKDDEGNPVLDEDGEQLFKTIKSQPKPSVNSEKLLSLAAANGVPEDVLAKYEGMNAGMQRMNVGNRLRGKARKQHALYDIEGNQVDVPAEYLTEINASENPTHNMDGSKIPVAKPAKAEAEEEA